MGINKVEIGERYVLRCGFTTGQVCKAKYDTCYMFEANILDKDLNRTGYRLSWKENGIYLTETYVSKFDIIEKIKDEK